jgi:DNA phosphorothioation-associated putative methyltransferase
VTGTEEGEALTRRSTEDLLVYLALGRFRRRPPMSALPIGLQRDIRTFFGSSSNGCRRADDRLFRAGDAEAVDDACRRSPVGKLLPNALYIHRTGWRPSTRSSASTRAAPARTSARSRGPT